MTEKIEEMLKKLHDALENDGSIEEVEGLCNQILILDPENPNAKIMKAALLMEQYWESKLDESGLEDYDDDSLIEVEKTVREVLDLIVGITRTDEISEEMAGEFSSMYADFLDEWGRQSLKHGSHSRNVLQRKHSESLIVAIMCWFPSRIEREQNKKMKLFLDKLVQLSCLQTNPRFLEEFTSLFKSKTVNYKILKDAAKLLIKVNKDVDKTSELGIETKKLKRAVRRKKIWKGIKWFFIVFIILNILGFLVGFLK